GWFHPQPCVTAAALAALATYVGGELPAITSAARYLRRTAEGGLWHPYWWYGPSYATCLAVRALGAIGPLPPAAAATTIAAVLSAREPDGGWSGRVPGRSLPFPTALCLSTLLALGYEGPELSAASDLLLARQRASGAFEASAELLVPGGVSAQTMTLVDGGRFTTACVLHALHALRERPAARHEDPSCSPTLHP
ncbi:MAG: hypothetical protein KDK70_29740, partial [Myxococcales bacterium]|nr:hypothetical protein [Myxococcales bacterium]